MELYFVFIAIGTALFVIGLIALVWSVRSGQFDDLDTPSLRMLLDDQVAPRPNPAATTQSSQTSQPSTPIHSQPTTGSTL